LGNALNFSVGWTRDWLASVYSERSFVGGFDCDMSAGTISTATPRFDNAALSRLSRFTACLSGRPHLVANTLQLA